ncbi:MAG: phosphatase PAP2 family protein [Methanobacteriota archaeon]|nr:MAG: phosphatase PAP2 family protein [Euryarchaeota archaeon]
MATLPFNEGIVDFFFQLRQNDWAAPLTSFFQFLTFLGSSTGYFILVLAIYWLFRKDIVYDLAVLLVATALTNLALKELIRNPRPYVTDGTYRNKWGLRSPSEIEETARSFSTPSGHAQTASTFFSYLAYKSKSRSHQIFFVLMILGIGISRPYLGVHYLEDVILGWIIGLLITYIFIRYQETLPNLSFETNRLQKYFAFFIVTLGVSIGFGVVNNFGQASQDITTFMGILFGIMIGFDQEKQKLNFDSKAHSILNGLGRFVMGAVVAFTVLFGLDTAFAAIAEDNTLLGFLLRFIRYFSFGLVSTFVCPWLFIKLKLSKSL